MISYASVMTLSPAVSRLSFQSLDNADVPFAGIAERFQRLPIGSTVVSRDGLLNAVELRHCGALSNPLLVSLCGVAAGEEATAIGDNGRPCKLSIRRQRGRIRNGAIEGDPISLCHVCSPRGSCTKVVRPPVSVRRVPSSFDVLHLNEIAATHTASRNFPMTSGSGSIPRPAPWGTEIRPCFGLSPWP